MTDSSDAPRIVVAGGGAAGFFAAITAAEANTKAKVLLIEKGAQFLTKVRISGGGRCNVTHACFEPRELSRRYPRGERALIAPFHRFGPSETVEWFEQRGVKLKTENDGRMFPVTDSSETIITCLVRSAEAAGVEMRTRCGIERAVKEGDLFTLTLTTGETLQCDRLLLATGGCRTVGAAGIAESLGHSIEPPVPSLFTFHIESEWLRKLPGLSVTDVEVSVPAAGLRERGPLLITHWGVSGPAVLRLSAWGARKLHALDYQFELRINWLPAFSPEAIRRELDRRRQTQPSRAVANLPISPLPARLWETLVELAGIIPDTRWNTLTSAGRDNLIALLTRMALAVTGKSLNKDEFVTCGGIRLREVDFKTMESRLCPGLYFAGELLDIDGITGGFNFQAAWTTGFLAGRAMATPAARSS